jgi:hypothetical protein
MKNVLQRALLISLVAVLFSCNRDKKGTDGDPSSSAAFTLTPIHSATHFTTFETKYYKGDTIRYSVRVTSSEGLSKFKVVHNTVTDSTVTNFPNNKDYTFDFEYVIEQNPSETVEFHFVAEEGNGTTKKSDKIEFIISDLYTKRVRLYNKEANLVRDSFVLWMRFPKTSSTFEKEIQIIKNSDVIINDVNNLYFVIASTHRDYYFPQNTSKTFYKKFFNDNDPVSASVNHVVSANTSIGSITYPNQIVELFNLNQSSLISPANSVNTMDNLSVGDNFVSKTIGQSSNPYLTYIFFEVIDIVDDNNTSDASGNELDYIELDIKYFSANRF